MNGWEDYGNKSLVNFKLADAGTNSGFKHVFFFFFFFLILSPSLSLSLSTIRERVVLIFIST